jgi:hypothetical protein
MRSALLIQLKTLTSFGTLWGVARLARVSMVVAFVPRRYSASVELLPDQAMARRVLNGLSMPCRVLMYRIVVIT